MRTLIKNCHLISPDAELENAAVLIDGKFIAGIYADGEKLPAADNTVDAGGKMVVPGFIDVHCHGRSGFDFTDAKQEGMDAIGTDKLKEGVTTLLPTTLTLPEEQLKPAMKTAAEYVRRGVNGAKIAGVHLEGPYINGKCCGAQNPAFVRSPDIDEVKRLDAISKVAKVSFAIEAEGGSAFVRELLAAGITPSCVHSSATYVDFKKANALGLKNLSHFCNQMTPLHHRDIGLVGAGLLHDEVFVELICDKVHISPDMIRLIFKIKGPEKVLLITDAMCASGLKDGDYNLGGLPVVVKDGAARLASNGALAGSTLLFYQGLKNIYEVTGMPLKELIKTTSWNQARSLGLEKLGRIEPGFYADILILKDDFSPEKVFVDGEVRA
ncbi:MAG: N-acetylglucosamine-6-phosphate deacetylase [Victivallaceae bacterium]|jgi:N-acetylglucosamine-6-phosphate deacetylase